MNPELLAAYHYLSSAIAQAFAALIALTAMFYIYRRQELNSRIKEVVNSLAAIIDLVESEFGTIERMSARDILRIIQLPLDQRGLRTSNLAYRSLLAQSDIIDNAKRKIEVIPNIEDKLWRRHPRLRQLLRNIEYRVARYNQMVSEKNRLQFSIKCPITLSAISMLVGIGALLFGWRVYDISFILTLGIMVFESLLAALALGWTVIVVIKMLGEPEEPQAEEGQG